MLSSSTNDDMPTAVDVLIVGAGPVGLLAACLLRQANMTVRILDAEYEPNHWGRGDNMHGRTMELLERAGLEEELVSCGVQVQNFNVYKNGKLSHTMPFVPDDVDSKYKSLLSVGQHITESSLQNHLANLDVQVERPCTVTSIQDNQGILVAHVSDLQGKGTQQVQVKYVLGCDGAHSDIRRQLGIVYDGDQGEISGGVIDALIRTNFSGKKDFCVLQGESCQTLSFFPRENGLARLLVHFNGSDMKTRNTIQMEDIQREAKRAMMPHRLEILGALYWSTYVVGQRQATTMDGMNERVFLLGDAAHCQSPTLGQGINTGFGDAFNLIWKLCLVERGILDRQVLKTYTKERHAVAKRVLAIDKRAAKEAAGYTDAFAQVVQDNRLFTSGFGIDYTTGSTAGMRAPNAKVVKASTGKKARLYDGVDWMTFSIVVLAHELSSASEPVVTKAYEWYKNEACAKWGDKTTFTLVTTTTHGVNDVVSNWIVLLDAIVIDKLNRAQCHRDYRCTNQAITMALVRPDGYVGAMCTGESMISQAQAYIDQVCLGI